MLAFFFQMYYDSQVPQLRMQNGWLVKRLRRRPLTAKTGVRFPYQLLTIEKNSPTQKKACHLNDTLFSAPAGSQTERLFSAAAVTGPHPK